MLPPRIDLTGEQMGRVVATFYAGIRAHPDLGPVFARHVSAWPEHEAKIADFWASAILHERSYSGNPMQTHISAGDVRPEHFKHWLSLFDRVLQQELTQDTARQWSELAHRIGRGLSYGVADHLRPSVDVPQF